MLHEAKVGLIEPDIENLIITNKGNKAIISKLTNKAKVYEQCFDMLFQIKKLNL